MAIEHEAAVESKQRNGTDTEATISGRLPPNKRLQRTGISVHLIDNLRVMQLRPGR